MDVKYRVFCPQMADVSLSTIELMDMLAEKVLVSFLLKRLF